MADYKIQGDITFTSANSTKAITISEFFQQYLVTSSATLTNTAGQANTVRITGTPTMGTIVRFEYEADIVLANSATSKVQFTFDTGVELAIIGDGSGVLPASYASIKSTIEFTFDGSSWHKTINASHDDTGWIGAAMLASDAVITDKILNENVTLDKLSDLTRGSVITGQTASNRPTALDAKTSGAILIGDGADVLSSVVSGDISIASTGVAAIGAGVIVNADVNASAAIAVSKLAAGTSTQILLNSGVPTPTWTTVTGDVTISNTGVTAIGASKVTNTMMADDSVTLSNLASTGQLYSFTTTTGTGANTTETALASFAMTSAIGDADGDVIDVYAYGSCANTATVKTIRIRFGATLATATQLAVNTTTASPQNVTWCIKGKIFRTGAASQKGNAEIIFTAIAAELDNFTAAETWSTSTVYLSGQNGTANANDIVLEGFEVKIGRTNNN